jgi:hypothetical protein
MTWLAALFLLAHALIHASYLSPRPPATAGGPAWPFELTRSWILSPLGLDGDPGRLLGIALIAVTLVAFAVAALAVIGIAGQGLFVPAVVAGSIASIALLALFFHPWLVLGIAIDVALLWAVLVARWTPQGGFPG